MHSTRDEHCPVGDRAVADERPDLALDVGIIDERREVLEVEVVEPGVGRFLARRNRDTAAPGVCQPSHPAILRGAQLVEGSR